MALKRPGQPTSNPGAQTEGATALATQENNLPATTSTGGTLNAVDFINQEGDVLIGFEALGGGSGTLHYVKMDGTDLVIGGFGEGQEQREKELQFIVSQARIYYYNRDTKEEMPYSPNVKKSPPGFSLRSEITFYDWVEGSDEPHEFRFTLPNNSTYRFRDYYEGLVKKGIRVNRSVTKVTVTRKKNDQQQIFSEAQFEYVGPAETE